MKDKKKKTGYQAENSDLKLVLDIIKHKLAYSQATFKYDMYLTSGRLI